MKALTPLLLAAAWKRLDVVTKSNCAACHKAAEQGVYED